MVFEEPKLADDPGNSCYFFEPSFSSLPKIKLFAYERFLILGQDDSRILDNNIGQMLKKHSFFIELLFLNDKLKDLAHLPWKLFVIVFAIDWNIDLAECYSSQKLRTEIYISKQWRFAV